MGDPAGIGGEIILRVGDFRVVDQLASRFSQGRHLSFKAPGEARAGEAEFMDLGVITRDVQFGSIDPMYGHAAHSYIIEALKLVFLNDVSAIVTCPINKTSINLAGIRFVGHTELLAHYAGVTDYVMMMAARAFRVSLVTIHIPVRADRNHRSEGIQMHSAHRCLFEKIFWNKGPTHQGMRPEPPCGRTRGHRR